MKFVAVDVETANADRSSICQIGLAVFCDGQLVGEWSSLVNPEAGFDAINVSIHGINGNAVRGQPSLPELERDLRQRLDGAIVVSHTQFDRVSLSRAFDKYGLSPINAEWIDSCQIARETWPALDRSS